MKIAIIGGGISGLTAAYHLQQAHDVHVFEANNYPGGHTNTIDTQHDGQTYAVDTGFIVFNHRTYPNFTRMLNGLDVESQPTTMSFSVCCEKTGLEYRGADLGGLFAQRRNLVNWRFYRLLRDIVRFGRRARALLTPGDDALTVGEYLRQERFSREFIQQYFLPLGSAVWSCPHDAVERFPIRFVVEFYENHGMLGVQKRPQWRVIRGGSRRYVDAITNRLRGTLQLNAPVASVRRFDGHVALELCRGEQHTFDHVIFACHSDQALRILGKQANSVERELLSAFPYERNVAQLHTDTSLLPRCRRAWASWNYRVAANPSNKATVTYNMNILQSLDSRQVFCVTLNGEDQVDPARVLRRIVYEHPVFNTRRSEAQSRHSEVIDRQRTSFCGAYWGNGFHEDGVNSALAVCQALLQPRDSISARGTRRKRPRGARETAAL